MDYAQSLVPKTWSNALLKQPIVDALLKQPTVAPLFPLALTMGVLYSAWNSRAGLLSSYLRSACVRSLNKYFKIKQT